MREEDLLLLLPSAPLFWITTHDNLKAGTSDIMSDKFEIAELINNWTFYRDQGSWDELLGTFADSGTISLSWFDGPHKDFVAASKQLATNRSMLVKHHIGTPRIGISGNKAISEVNVTIMVRAKTPAGEVDTTSYARFYDHVEKRAGHWQISKRVAIYEWDRADPVQQPALPEAMFKDLDQYPAELRFLASSIRKMGGELSKSTTVDKSPELADLYKSGNAWLAAK
jgi:hypothetical protein